MADESVKVIEAQNGQYKIDLPQSAIARIDVVDIDFVIQTKSGDRLILAAAAIEATAAKPPAIAFADRTVSSASMFSQVERVQDLEVPVPAMASLKAYEAKKTDGKRSFLKEGQPHDGAEVAQDTAPPDMAPLRVAPPSTVEKLLEQVTKSSSDPKRANFELPPNPLSVPEPAKSSSKGNNGEKVTEVPSTFVIYWGNVQAPVRDDGAVGGGGGNPLSAATRHLPSKAAEQFLAERIDGTNTSETIYADDSSVLGGAGSYAKDLNMVLQGKFQSIDGLLISGVPDNISFEGAERQGNGVWKVVFSGTQPAEGFSAKLIYSLYEADSDHPLHQSFTLTFTAQITTVKGEPNTVSSTCKVEVRDVDNAADLVRVDENNVDIIVLPAQGVPNEVYGMGGNDTIHGGESRDTLYGGTGADTLYGRGGADTLIGGEGADSLDGGAGTDVADYSASAVTADLVINLDTNVNTGGEAQGDRLSNIEVVIGGAGHDRITGNTTAATTILGGAGNDTLAGGSGADSLDGGDGTDFVSYANASAAVTVNLGATGATGWGGDRLSGLEGAIGSDFNDTLIGRASAASTLRGGLGDDLMKGGSAGDSFDGGGGTDTVSYADATSAVTVDQTAGGHGSGHAAGDSFTTVERIVGTNYADTFIGGTVAGSATMDGGTGSDWVSYEHAGSGATLNLASGGHTGSAANDLLANVENVIGSDHNDTLTGLDTGSTLKGGAGNDTLAGGLAADHFDGGADSDVVTYAGAGAPVTIDQTSNGLGVGHAEGDTFTGVETIIATTGTDTFIGGGGTSGATMDGSGGADWVSYAHLDDGLGVSINLSTGQPGGGGAAGDRLVNVEHATGSQYDDTLVAHGGGSTLQGGGGNDTLTGGAGTDRLEGGAGTDVVNYLGSGGVTVDQTGGGHGAGWAANDVYAGIETIIGSSDTDTFIGGTASGSAVMDGGGGSDWVTYEFASAATVDLVAGANGGAAQEDSLVNVENVHGSAQNDVFYANDQANSLDGGAGSDTVDYSGDAAAHAINLATNVSSGGRAAGDVLSNIEVLVGGSGKDTLTGYADVATTLRGGAGDDTLAGGSAADSFDGGTGNDLVSYDGLMSVTVGGGSGNRATGDTYSGIETILGSSAVDTFITAGISGVDTLDGGDGADWVSYAGAGSGATVDLASGSHSGAATHALANMENVIGSDHADTLTAATAGSTLRGEAGNDLLYGGAGADSLDGGAGTDVVSYDGQAALTIDQRAAGTGGTGAAAGDRYSTVETILATGNNDTFVGQTGAGSATMDGGAGSDWVSYAAASQAATLDLSGGHTGAALNDVLANVENILGSGYNDTLTGLAGASSTLLGGGGNDLLAGGSLADSFDGGLGLDVVTYAGQAAVTIDQTSGNRGTGAAAGDRYSTVETILATGNGDTFMGQTGAGSATMDGGAGSDWVSYQYASAAATLTLGGDHTGAADGDVLLSVENIVGSAYDDTLTGLAGASSTLLGGAGNDLLAGGAQADSFDGGLGIDVVTYAGQAALTIDQRAGGTAGTGAAAGDRYSTVETILATANADTFVGQTGTASATMDGGAGSDWVSYAEADQAATLSLGGGHTGAALNDVLANVENVLGSDYNDTLTGLSGASSTLLGGDGDDLLAGGAQADSFDGGAGTDVVTYAGQAALTIDQTSGNRGSNAAAGDRYSTVETILASGNADTFMGGTGAGSATMDGGAGSDWVSYQYAASAATVILGGSHTGAAANDVLANVENILGSDYHDTLTGLSGASSTLLGGAGNDLLAGGAQADSFDGGAGVDVVTYAGQAALIIDQTGGNRGSGAAAGDRYSTVETILATGNADTFMGGSGTESATMDGGAGSDWVSYAEADQAATLTLGGGHTGAALNDVLANVENIVGSDYHDTLTGLSGASSTLLGGAGNDLLAGGSQADSFDGGLGLDVVTYAGQAALTIDQRAGGTGGTGAAAGDRYSTVETILATGNNDTFLGGTGAGSATMDGGAGSDWVSYAGAGQAVTLALGGSHTGAALNDVLTNVENVVGSGNNDTLTGLSSASSTLLGGGGNDLLVGGAAADSFDGGAGTDVVSYAGQGALTIDQTSGNRGSGVAAGDRYSTVETILATSNADTFMGGTAAGAATMDGAGGSDWVSYQYAGSGATLVLGGAHSGAAQNDVLANVENVRGSGSNDTVTGDGGANILLGAGGADTLTGGGGNDTLEGGAGADSLDGGAGVDTADYSGDASDHVVNLTTDVNSGGDAAGDHLSSIEVVIGGSGNDTLTGAAAASTTLLGGAGADTLAGGSAADRFDGGTGSDVVTYAGAGAVTVDQNGSGHGAGNATDDAYTNVETIIATAGTDSFIGGTDAGSATMDGGAGGDWISYEYAIQAATVNLATGINGGSAADDKLVNIENVKGSALADVFTANGQANTFDGNAGTDTVDYSADAADHVINLATNISSGGIAAGDEFSNIEIIIGGAGDDTLTGNASSGTTLRGGLGDDILRGGAAADSFDGGGGTDLVTFAASLSAITVDQTSGGHGAGDAVGDTFSTVETILATANNDSFIGGTGAGSATMDGAGGSDWVTYRWATSGAELNLANGTRGGSAVNDRLVNVENVTGSDYGDTLTGTVGVNTLIGGAGDDSLYGGLGNDRLEGGAGADRLDGGGGTDMAVYASAATIDQTAGNHGAGDAAGDSFVGVETIVASGGVDTFIGGTAAGSATMDGADGADWVSYQYAASGATVDLATGSNGGSALNDRLVNIENVTGSAHDDLFIGSTDAVTSTMDGAAGSDWVSYQNAGAGATLDLAAGSHSGAAQYHVLVNVENVIGSDTFADTLTAGTSGSTLLGGGGNDTLVAGTGADSLNGGTGTDTADYSADAAAHIINLATNVNSGGTAAGDRLTGIEVLVGGSGADTLTGNAAASTTLRGGGGNDTLVGGTAADSFDGGSGTDVVSYAGLTALTIDQTTGNRGTGAAAGDTYSTVETILATGNDDTFMGGTASGSATMDGAAGADWVSYQYAGSGATLTLGGAHSGAAQYDVLTNVENVRGSASKDVLTGNGVANILLGAGGDDSLYGAGGDDTLEGGAGADLMDGGLGTDVVTYANSSADVTVDQTGGGHGGGDAAGDSFAAVETIIASANDDTFMGGTASGSATMDGATGSDWVSYEFASSAATLALGGAHSGAAQNDVLTGIENIVGSGYNDTLTGLGTGSTLMGGGGNDLLTGGAAADSFDGGAGTDVVSYAGLAALAIDQTSGNRGTGSAAGDRYSTVETIVATSNADTFFGGTSAGSATMAGGAGSDWVSYQYAGSAVTLALGGAHSGSAANDVLVSVENVIGSSYDDTLTAIAGGSTLQGGTGNDRLIAGAGTDSLDGGAGADVVSYANSGSVTIDQTGTVGGAGDAAGDAYANVETIIAGASADTFIGGTTSALATMDGAGGSDWVSYQAWTSGSSVGATLNLNTGAHSGAAQYDVFTNVENVLGTAYDDTLTASTSGGTLLGAGGDDLLYGGTGTDSFDGGTGTNVVSYAGLSAVTVDQVTAGSRGAGAALNDRYTNVDTIVATSNADTFFGATASGSATMDGGAGSDWVSYDDATSAVTLTLGGAHTGAALNDSLANVENVIGSDYADILTGQAAASSTLRGGLGNDTLAGGTAADSFDGGTGTDVVTYAGFSAVAIDQTTGNRGAGSAAGDKYTSVETIIATSNDDTFFGGTSSGSAIMDGGAGNNWISYQYAAAVKLTLGGSHTGSATYDNLVNIENVIGSASVDTIIGDALTNTIVGSASADTMDGAGGIDTVSYAIEATTHVINLATNVHTGGAAAGDSLANFEVVIGGTGIDTITGNATTSTTLMGNAGNDTLIGGTAADSFDGGVGTDIVTYAGLGALSIDQTTAGGHGSGSAAGDRYSTVETIVGTSNADTFIGGTSAGSATMHGGAGGSDWITYEYWTSGTSAGATLSLASTTRGGASASDLVVSIENIIGSQYADTLTASINIGANTILSGSGNDLLVVGSGTTIVSDDDDILDGGAGTDTVSYASDGVGVSVFLGGVDSTGRDASSYGITLEAGYAGFGTGNASGDQYANIENIIGGSAADHLVGDAGHNSIQGNAGNDLLAGGGGGDTYDGGAGTDTLSYADYGSGVTVFLGGTDQSGNGAAYYGVTVPGGFTGFGLGGAAGDFIRYVNGSTAIENLIGSSSNDLLVGDGNANVLSGNGGVDKLYGMAGNDTFLGGQGTATLDGGLGIDMVDYSAVAGAVTVDLSNNANNDGWAANDTLVAIENIYGSNYADDLTGTSAANTIWAGNGDDVIEGLGGADKLYGQIGNDTFVAGSGAESLDGGTGSDWVSYASSAAVTVTLGGTATGGNAAGDTLISIENIIGSANADTLTGDANANTLAGGGGADKLYGMGGDDAFVLTASQLGSVATIDGGTGANTLTAADGDLHAKASVISYVQTADVHDGAGSDAFTLSSADIQNIVDAGTSSSLTFILDSGDTFSITPTTGQTVNTTVVNANLTTYDIVSTSTGAQIAHLDLQRV